MEYLKPPTDSLYKFLAIAGLVVFVLAIFLTEPYIADLTKQFNDIEREQVKTLAAWRVLYLQGMPIDQVPGYTNWTVRDAIEEPYPSDEKRSELADRFEELREKALRMCNFPASNDENARGYWTHVLRLSVDEYNKMVSDREGEHILSRTINSARKLLIDIEGLESLQTQQWGLKRQYGRARTFQWWGAWCGVFATAIGFYFWYFRIQRYEDAKLRSEAHEADKTTPKQESHPPAKAKHARRHH